MFMANRDPDADRRQIDALISRLGDVSARRFVLISSIAVLAGLAAGNDETTTAFEDRLAYGKHRRLLESFCESHFETCLVVRLPALFGPGLRKNFVFDLMNPVPTLIPQGRLDDLLGQLPLSLREGLIGLYGPDPSGMLRLDRDALNSNPSRPALDQAIRAAGFSATQFHSRDTTYQYYDMSRLWNDIAIAAEAQVSHIHLATEPLRAADIHARLMGFDMPHTSARVHTEDMHTRHAALWGRSGSYIEDAGTVMEKLAAHRLVAE